MLRGPGGVETAGGSWGRQGGGAGAEGCNVLRGSAVVVAVHVGREAEVLHDGTDDFEDGAGADVFFDIGGCETFDEFGAEGVGGGFGLGIFGGLGDVVFDGAQDLAACGGALFGGGGVGLVLIGDGLFEFVGEEHVAADAAGDAVEQDHCCRGRGGRGRGGVEFRFGRGSGFGHDFAVQFAGDVHAHPGELVEGDDAMLGSGLPIGFVDAIRVE